MARDIAHARIKQMLDEGKPMPEYFKKHPIYYAGPAKTPKGMPSGSFGPDDGRPYGPLRGSVPGARRLAGHGGQGQPLATGDGRLPRNTADSTSVRSAVRRLCWPKIRIKSVEVVDFPELGMEAVRKIYVENFPAFILVDDKGNDFFAQLKH